MVHDLDPFAWKIAGDFGVRWYGLSYMAGFICAYFFIKWLAQRQKVGLTEAMVGDLITYGAIGTLIGGRLGYVIFYGQDLLFKFKTTFPYWGVLAVNEGGMASHGGMIGIVVATFLFARKYSLNGLYLLDLLCVIGPVGVFFGRIANFINAEHVGRPCDPGFSLAVKFPQDIYSWPADGTEKLSQLSVVIEKLGISNESWRELIGKFSFDVSAREQVYSILSKIVNSIQDGNIAAKEAIAPLLTPRYPSQLFEALGEGLFLFVILFLFWKKPRKPGFITALFLLLYAVARIVGEHFRMPDAHIGFQWLGLTRGQWLSIGMVGFGLLVMLISVRSKSLQVPGWSQGRSIKLGRK